MSEAADYWNDTMPARRKPLPMDTQAMAREVLKEVKRDGPLTNFDSMMLSDAKSVRVSIPLTDFIDTKRALQVLADRITPMLANAERISGDRSKLFFIKNEMMALSKKLMAYNRAGRKRV